MKNRNRGMEQTDSSQREEGGRTGWQKVKGVAKEHRELIEKEEIKLSSFTNNMIFYVGNLKEFTRLWDTRSIYKSQVLSSVSAVNTRIWN